MAAPSRRGSSRAARGWERPGTAAGQGWSPPPPRPEPPPAAGPTTGCAAIQLPPAPPAQRRPPAEEPPGGPQPPSARPGSGSGCSSGSGSMLPPVQRHSAPGGAAAPPSPRQPPQFRRRRVPLGPGEAVGMCEGSETGSKTETKANILSLMYGVRSFYRLVKTFRFKVLLLKASQTALLRNVSDCGWK